jgi:hypothetical protein
MANWFKRINANSFIINEIVSLLTNAYNNNGFIDESKIYNIVSQIPDEVTFDNMLQKAISLAMQSLRISSLTVPQNQIIEQLQNNFRNMPKENILPQENLD